MIKRSALLAIGIAFFAGSIWLFLESPRKASTVSASPAPQLEEVKVRTASVGNYPINIEIADTDALRTQGLSERQSLAENAGMLFVFPQIGKYGFWMKDMKFPLDMIWIGADDTIVAIDKNLSPDTFPQVFYPPTDVKYVLEVPGNFSDTHGIRVGNSFSTDI